MLLKPLLQWLSKVKGFQFYIWKAELQARGQVHYHITSNQFIYWKELRDKWNYLQRRAGYLDNYYKKHGHYNANSTDVHKVYNDENISGYLEKYISKTQSGAAINGKIWDCSNSLKGKKLFETNYYPYHQKDIMEYARPTDNNILINDFFTIYKFDKDTPCYKFLSYHERAFYNDWKQGIIEAVKKKKAVFNIPAGRQKPFKQSVLFLQSLNTS